MFAFQSQGMSSGPWIGPSVEETMSTLRDAGRRGVFIQPVGFLCDHVEVLFDLDVEARQTAEEVGITLRRAGTAGDHPCFIEMLADRVTETVSQAGHGPL